MEVTLTFIKLCLSIHRLLSTTAINTNIHKKNTAYDGKQKNTTYNHKQELQPEGEQRSESDSREPSRI